MRQALYRQYRPKTFAEVIGQETVKTILLNQAKSDTFGHAYLFTGPKGTGKTSVARLLAKTANCTNRRDGEPCNDCLCCKAFDAGTMMDVLEIDAASHTGIDAMREIIEQARLVPTLGRYKVYIIDEAHQLSKPANNALLKTLEEPPAYVMFILATTEADKILPTIVSRCQHFDFSYLPSKEVVALLRRTAESEKIEIDDAALEFIASQSGGGLRDAMGLLDQATFLGGRVTAEGMREWLGVVPTETVIALTKTIVDKDLSAGLKQLQGIYVQGYDVRSLMHQWAGVARNLLAIKAGAGDIINLAGADLAPMQALSDRMTPAQVMGLFEGLIIAGRDSRGSVAPMLPLELMMARLIGLQESGVSAKVSADDTQKTAQAAEPAKTPNDETTMASSVPVDKMSSTDSQSPAENGWLEVVAKVREVSKTFAGLLAGATAVVGEGEVVISGLRPFDKEAVERRDNMDKLIAALESLKLPTKVVCKLQSAPANEKRVIDEVAEMFGASK